MERSRLKVAAAIPALNEEASIAKVIVGLKKIVDDVLVCDDGSRDETGEIARELGAVVVTHERNNGYGAAITTLFDLAKKMKADVLVTIDGDGQHDPLDIPALLEPIVSGTADIVIGSRTLDTGDSTPRYRKLGITVIGKTMNIFSSRTIIDTQSGFRAYSARALSLVVPSEMGMGASVEILTKAREKGLSITEVPIRVKYQGRAARNPLYHGLDVILALVKHVSIRHPLLFYGLPGFVFFLGGLGFGLWMLDIYAATKAVATNVALVAIAGVTIGLVLMTTSILLWVLVTVFREEKL